MINIEPFELYGWQGQRLSQGPLKMVITPAIGGRIISMRYEGRELLFVNRELSGQVFDFSGVTDLEAMKKEMGFRLWGGDKTWVAPQQEWRGGVPPLELDAGAYALTWEEQTAVMMSPICRETGLQIVRKIRLNADGSVFLREEFHNKTTDTVIHKGIWNVTQLIRPCLVFIPADKGAIRSYHHQDATLPPVDNIFKEDQGWCEIPCRSNVLFKCGGMPNDGHVMVKVPMGGRKDLVWLKSFRLDKAGNYAHKAAVEVFNSDRLNYAEVELHAPLVPINPGESYGFEQQWRFKKI